MKILGRNGEESYSDFIVEMTAEEFRTITGYRDTSRRLVPTKVDVCAEWKKGMDCLRGAQEAIKIPNALRSIADCLEMVREGLEAIEKGVKLPEVGQA